MTEDEQGACVPAVFPQQQDPRALTQGPGAERGCPSFSHPPLGVELSRLQAHRAPRKTLCNAQTHTLRPESAG